MSSIINAVLNLIREINIITADGHFNLNDEDLIIRQL